MLKLRSPNQWSCLPTSFAMILNISVEEMLKTIGHDGSEIVWQEYPEPQCRRSFHIQECVLVAHKMGKFGNYFQVTTEHAPHLMAARYVKTSLTNKEVADLLAGYEATLFGTTLKGSRHAVAWNGFRIIDPNGTEYELKDFKIESFIIFRS